MISRENDENQLKKMLLISRELCHHTLFSYIVENYLVVRYYVNFRLATFVQFFM